MRGSARARRDRASAPLFGWRNDAARGWRLQPSLRSWRLWPTTRTARAPKKELYRAPAVTPISDRRASRGPTALAPDVGGKDGGRANGHRADKPATLLACFERPLGPGPRPRPPKLHSETRTYMTACTGLSIKIMLASTGASIRETRIGPKSRAMRSGGQGRLWLSRADSREARLASSRSRRAISSSSFATMRRRWAEGGTVRRRRHLTEDRASLLPFQDARHIPRNRSDETQESNGPRRGMQGRTATISVVE